MSKLDLLNRIFGVMVLTSVLLNNSQSSEPKNTKTAVKSVVYNIEISDKTNYNIASYLEKNCRDGMERAIIYYPKTGKIENITLDRNPERANIPRNLHEKKLDENEELIFAHSHINTLSDIYNSKNPEHIYAINKFGDYTLKRRGLSEIPSSGIYSDLHVMFDALFHAYSKSYRTPKLPEPKFDFRIVVLDSLDSPRVISYGVKDEVIRDIRNFDYKGNFADYMRSAKMIRLMKTYNDIVMQYKESHSEVFEISEKEEPSFIELSRLINEKTVFLIKDHGYITLK
jgi:hypothetical protein